MKSTLTTEKSHLGGPYYRQHPELVDRMFAGPHDTLPKDEVLAVVQKLPDGVKTATTRVWFSRLTGCDGLATMPFVNTAQIIQGLWPGFA